MGNWDYYPTYRGPITPFITGWCPDVDLQLKATCTSFPCRSLGFFGKVRCGLWVFPLWFFRHPKTTIVVKGRRTKRRRGFTGGEKSVRVGHPEKIWVFSKIMVTPNHPFNRVFHYKPSILGHPYFWKHPYISKLGWLMLAGVSKANYAWLQWKLCTSDRWSPNIPEGSPLWGWSWDFTCTQMLNVWYIYLHLPPKLPKCR